MNSDSDIPHTFASTQKFVYPTMARIANSDSPRRLGVPRGCGSADARSARSSKRGRSALFAPCRMRLTCVKLFFNSLEPILRPWTTGSSVEALVLALRII
jgi:hypothetical protein